MRSLVFSSQAQQRYNNDSPQTPNGYTTLAEPELASLFRLDRA
jgi:hypothetical protein